MRKAGVLGIWPGIAATEFKGLIVDGMRVGVAKQRTDSLAQAFVCGELKGKILRKIRILDLLNLPKKCSRKSA